MSYRGISRLRGTRKRRSGVYRIARVAQGARHGGLGAGEDVCAARRERTFACYSQNSHSTRGIEIREGIERVFGVLEATQLNEEMTRLVIDAPEIARKALPGQFVILHADERAERIPLTISEADVCEGAITVIFQSIGASTERLAELSAGDAIRDVAGPLGRPTLYGDARKVCVIGGGLGCAIAWPQVKRLAELGRHVDAIVGFRTAGLVILEDEFRSAAGDLTVMTDDGSNGNGGFVTTALERKLSEGCEYDLVIAIGPPQMMRAVCDITREAGIETLVSLNSIMVDGTGMCGCCRVKVGGVWRHACVDGPDFDGQLVDWDGLIARNRMYMPQEEEARGHLVAGGAAASRDGAEPAAGAEFAAGDAAASGKAAG